MKKSVIAAGVCFAVGVAGMAVTLPMAAKDGINLFNEAIQQEAAYRHWETAAGVTELRVINETDYGNIMIGVKQSEDNKVHFYSFDNPFHHYQAEITAEKGKAVLKISEEKTGAVLINRENLMQVIGSELHYEGNFILEVPKTLSIVSSEADAVYLMPGGGVEFVNAAQIRNYGYVPSEEYNWKLKYEEVSAQTEGMKEEIERLNDEIARLQEESMYEDYAQEYSSETVITASENGKIFPSDIIKMENDLRAYQKEFSEGDVSREVYFTRANEMMGNILEARIQQAIHAGKEEFLYDIEEMDRLQRENFELQTEITIAQRDYNSGAITQEDYNRIVRSYETSGNLLNAEINEKKANLEAQGYHWDSAVWTES